MSNGVPFLSLEHVGRLWRKLQVWLGLRVEAINCVPFMLRCWEIVRTLVSLCKWAVSVGRVHPVAVRRAAFCIVCIFVILD